MSWGDLKDLKRLKTTDCEIGVCDGRCALKVFQEHHFLLLPQLCDSKDLLAEQGEPTVLCSITYAILIYSAQILG